MKSILSLSILAYIEFVLSHGKALGKSANSWANLIAFAGVGSPEEFEE